MSRDTSRDIDGGGDASMVQRAARGAAAALPNGGFAAGGGSPAPAARAALWEHSADLLLVIAADGTVEDANPAWQTVLERSPAGLAGAAFDTLLHPEDRTRARADLAWTRERGSHHFVTRCGHRRGHYQSIAWSASSRDGVVYAVGREQGRASVGADAGATGPGRLHRLLAMGRLSGGIAHDFNNLLQALRNALELIRRAESAAELQRWTDSALRVVDRGARLTAQLMASSTGHGLEPRPVAVASLLAGMKELLQRTLPPMVRVDMELARDTGSTLGDPARLEAAVLNLALNGCDAMPDGGLLTISCHRQLLAGDSELPTGAYLRIAVSDTGAGMSDAVRERAFEHFFTTKPLGKGAGLGLSQVHAFSRQCGGTTRIESSSPHGTTIAMLLPALGAVVDAVAAAEQPGADPDVATIPVTPGDTVVLVVDDDSDVRKLLCDSLRVLGYRAVPVADGLSALAAIDRHQPDVLVVDVAMPGMDGAEVARQARQAKPGVGIVLVSGEQQALLGAGGGALVLRKPFDLAALSAAVEQAAARR